MNITFDPNKRAETLRTRHVDFLDAAKVFAGVAFTFRDERFDYAEPRYLTVGMIEGRMMIVVWTPDEENAARRVISMRKANAREQARYLHRLGEARRP